MTPVRFLPEAEAEFLREVEYYSAARTGTGVRFSAAVEAAIVLAVRHPSGGAPSFKGTKSVVVRGFPFSVVFRASRSELLVVAIAPHRRRPGYWSPRVGDGSAVP